MKIVVLCGGLSPERDVSISTGTKMAAALRSLGHKVILTDMYFINVLLQVMNLIKKCCVIKMRLNL